MVLLLHGGSRLSKQIGADPLAGTWTASGLHTCVSVGLWHFGSNSKKITSGRRTCLLLVIEYKDKSKKTLNPKHPKPYNRY